jgi:hypothetical protein
MADEPKIFIDEDWKARAQREKEELQKRVEAEAAARTAVPVVPPAPETATDMVGAEASPEPGYDVGPGGEEMEGEEPYEANFDALLSSLATQTMFALGVIPQQGGGQVMINLDQAKFSIDILAMLHDKTRGNLTAEEQAALEGTLAELQRLFVARVQQFEAQAMRQAGIDPNNLRAE